MPGQTVKLTITREDGSKKTQELLCHIDTADKMDYFKNGGIFHYVLRRLAA